jgi:PAS domain S-box-containing protein/putative nucleotidyltransferase with HDIG domain
MLDDSINILLIEDEDPHAELIERAFNDQGNPVRIHRVKSLAEARAHMLSHEPALIIADWRLPDGESMALLPDHHDPLAIPIILMTSYGNERIAVEALKSGALDYVVKSPESMLDMPHLAERAIEQWVARAERIRMQKALLESESQFRLLAENASDMISRHGVDGLFIYISPACENILGYKPEELVGSTFFHLVHPEDLPAITKLISEYDGGQKTTTITYRARHKNTQDIWLETSARAILDRKDGSVVEIQATSRDITDRKNAERELQNAHDNLQEAYERTIEGWVRALDLRDRETEGHTQRVTELTLKVAQKLGLADEDLVHIRRGALLHDMGKMAIPDEILQKPGPLNEAEWEKMRRHPLYAHEMLSPITYLHPALDIPLSHHERWDGSGYPRGLKGTEIPLTARLFAVVDVWDALSTDRPYRKRLPREEVVKYLTEKSGVLFDPELVEVFLKVVETEE